MENFHIKFQFEDTIDKKATLVDDLNERISECDDEIYERKSELDRTIENKNLELTRKYARRERKEQKVLDMQDTLK